jgi:fucose permease
LRYQRDGFTRSAFGALIGFGFLNAVLGPALPYLRAVEHIPYLAGSAHQAAFAVGGGAAGLLAARRAGGTGRAITVRLGLAAAALAGLGIGYGNQVWVTVTAALAVSFFGTSALIRLWAALADAHGAHRTVAMAEGEVSVSLGGIIAPLCVAAAAATVLSWRFSFVIGAGLTFVAVLASTRVRIPRALPADGGGPDSPGISGGPQLRPTLVVVFAIVALEFSLSFWLASYLNDSVGVEKGLAAAMVSVLYAANLLGRLLASRLARRVMPERLLLASIGLALAGLPFLLLAHTAAVAAAGIALAGAGIGATFPLASSLHLAASPRGSNSALGQVLSVAALGQIAGPVVVAAIAQGAGLRIGLLVLPLLAVLAAAVLVRSFRGGIPGH